MDIGTLVTRSGHRFGDRTAVEGVEAADRRTFAELADRVALLSDGRIAAVGTHSQLLESTPAYADVLSAESEEVSR